MTPAEAWGYLLAGFRVTLALTAVSMALALVLGLVIGVLEVAPLRPVRTVAAGYVELFRDIPLLPVLIFAYLGLPMVGLGLEGALASAAAAFGISADLPIAGAARGLGSAFATAAIALGFYTAAYVAEAVRGSLETVPFGQIEAARALGLGYLAVLRLVLLPQALRSAIPPLGSVLIALVKNSSIASAVAVAELMYQTEFVIGRTFATWPMLAAFALYLLVTIPLAGVVNHLERRWLVVR
jgi:putative glutamine transport system permease protein